LLVVTDNILLDIRVEAVVVSFVDLAVGLSSWLRCAALILNSFVNVEEIDCFIFHLTWLVFVFFLNLKLFAVPHVRKENSGCLLLSHRESELILAILHR